MSISDGSPPEPASSRRNQTQRPTQIIRRQPVAPAVDSGTPTSAPQSNLIRRPELYYETVPLRPTRVVSANANTRLPQDVPEPPPPEPIEVPDSVFQDVIRDELSEPAWSVPEVEWFPELEPEPYEGIGHEYLGLALFEMDITQPLNSYRFRFESANGFKPPDRAEYLWARPKNIDGGRGPAALEQSVDYQDFRMAMELGGKRLSVTTEIPIRLLDPVVNPDTASIGDMSVTTKTLLCDGDNWQITQILRTYTPTGSTSKGLGNGHVSMEPGLLMRYRWSDITYLHGEMKYWFPLGGHPEHSGQILRWGIGVSHLLYDSDSLALLPTLELVSHSVLDGMEAVSETMAEDIDAKIIAHLHPGLRIVMDHGGDLGEFELGVSGAIDLGSDGWYESLFRFEFRKIY